MLNRERFQISSLNHASTCCSLLFVLDRSTFAVDSSTIYRQLVDHNLHSSYNRSICTGAAAGGFSSRARFQASTMPFTRARSSSPSMSAPGCVKS